MVICKLQGYELISHWQSQIKRSSGMKINFIIHCSFVSIYCIYPIKAFNIMQKDPQTSKYLQLIQTLTKNKQSSQALLQRINKTLVQAFNAKEDLKHQDERMQKWEKQFRNAIRSMGQRMFITSPNPIKLNASLGGISCNSKLPESKSLATLLPMLLAHPSSEITFLTGAGISVCSNLPVFRGSTGLYIINLTFQGHIYHPDEFLTYSFFKKYPQPVWRWIAKLYQMVRKSKPGTNHWMIDEICKILKVAYKKKVSVVTTNVDGYHLIGGQTDSEYLVQEIHGNVRYFVCEDCGNKDTLPQDFGQNQQFGLFDTNPQQSQHRVKTIATQPNIRLSIPPCKICKSTSIRPYTLFFDQKYCGDYGGAILQRQNPFPLVLCLGSSLQTGMAAKIVAQSHLAVQVNPECVVEVGNVYQFRQTCEDFLTELIDLLKSGQF